MSNLPTYEDVCSAAAQIAGHAYRTPCLEHLALSKYLGTKVRFKSEHLQQIGAFKFRGAFNAISRLSDEQLAEGILTFSSGNHAQAVAKACQLLGAKATIVMPNNAPKLKLAGARRLGAKIILYDPQTEDREEIAARLNHDKQMTLIPPYNHPHVIAGQGTATLEVLHDYPNTEQIFTPCGGGGLLSGSCLAAHGLKPDCEVFGVEPETAADAKASLRTGSIVRIPYPDTIADGVRTLALGDLTFAIIQTHVKDILVVSEDAIKEAVSTMAKTMKQLVEPSAVLGLAALLENPPALKSEVAIIVSGGNADIETIQTICHQYAGIQL